MYSIFANKNIYIQKDARKIIAQFDKKKFGFWSLSLMLHLTNP